MESNNTLKFFGIAVTDGEITITLSGEEAALLAKTCREARSIMTSEEKGVDSLHTWSKLFAIAATAAACQWYTNREGREKAEIELQELLGTI
jgi:hypothetical protein